ncbi:MAG: prenyltransferase/squalene oxidase repeat-containing protein [Planctomycetota bacterium]
MSAQEPPISESSGSMGNEPVPLSPKPPPPPPRATLPPVRPPTSAPLRFIAVEAEAPADSTAPEVSNETQGTPTTRGTQPALGLGAQVPVAVSSRSRWKNEPSRVIIRVRDRAIQDESSGDKDSNRSDLDLEPVRRDMPAWLVSMIIHLLVLLILALLTSPVGQGISRIVLEFGEATDAESVELAEFALDSSDAAIDAEAFDSDAPVNLNMQELFESTANENPMELLEIEIGDGPTVDTSQPMFGGRTGAMKQALLAMFGGDETTVEAVERGLRWLARQQRPNGSWSLVGPYDDGAVSENDIAATAMALLAFLGDGQTHVSGEYTQVVNQGLRWLVKQQNRKGKFTGKGRGDEVAYAQAQAMIAVCEAYGMTKESWLKVPAQLSVDYAAWAQSSKGGWRYQPRFDADLSVTGWYVMGLVSAKSAGLEGTQSPLEGARYYLDAVESYDGAAYGYQQGRAPSAPMTAEGLLCRQYMGWPRTDNAMDEGVSTLLAEAPLQANDMNVYYWYYGTQVMHHFGGSPWERWNAEMKPTLTKMQVKRGNESGSWAPQADDWGRHAGRLYTTCMCLYCLEVYYRHMPLYKDAAKNTAIEG